MIWWWGDKIIDLGWDEIRVGGIKYKGRFGRTVLEGKWGRRERGVVWN